MEQADFDSEKFGRLFVFLRMAVLLAICMALFAPANASAATAGFGPVPRLANQATRTGQPRCLAYREWMRKSMRLRSIGPGSCMLEGTSIAQATQRCRALRVGTVKHGTRWAI